MLKERAKGVKGYDHEMAAGQLSDAEKRARMRDGEAAFAHRQFYEAHEIWEELWNAVAGPERVWIQALIQIATAHYHLERERPDLCARLLRKAIGKIPGTATLLYELELERFRGEAERLLATLSD